jgi:iron complex outermembrane recepter protein
MKTRYLVSCAAAALSLAGGAYADDSTAPATAAVSEVIVTATRRNESVQKVPSTVQAFSGQTLQTINVTGVGDLVKYTPNVTFSTNGPGQGNIAMRGLSAGFAGGQSSAATGSFPNVAIYLDDQSLQFPGRNVDIYVADMDRVEVLEGPQGTLFGGGAEAGALRYITNKPKVDKFEADVEGGAGLTDGGAPNWNGQVMVNVPIIDNKVAVRAVIYDEHQGGYIDNVYSTFTRSANDHYNDYFDVNPALQPVYNNAADVAKNQNPTEWLGGRVEVLWDINPDWNVLVTDSYQKLNADGISAEEPYGLDFQKLGPLEETSFVPAFDHDEFNLVSWTVNGKVGPLKLVYTGGYLLRHVSQQNDYTGYSRAWGEYYQCTGSGTGWGSGPTECGSPAAYWTDKVKNTHWSHEFRVSSPDTWRLRFIAGFYWERFILQDDMNFNYRTLPGGCDNYTLAELNAARAAGQFLCIGNVQPLPTEPSLDPSVRGPNTAFGEDLTRAYDQTAGFVSVDFDIIPNKLTISGGTRWYQYQEYEAGTEYYVYPYVSLDYPDGPNCVDGYCNYTPINKADHTVTYVGFRSRANITWKITPDVLTYFTFSQGFRPGGFNRTQGSVLPLDGVDQYEKPNGYGPDTLTNYEIGLKSQWLDHRLLLNLSAYYMQWDNIQMALFNPDVLGNTTFGTNGPNYNIKGFEFQFVGKPIPALTISGSGSYNNAVQANSPCLVSNIPTSPTYGQCITESVQRGATTPTPVINPLGAPGTPPAFSPTFQGNIRGRYEFTVADKYKAYVQIGGSYMGGMWNQLATYPSGEGLIVPTTTVMRYYQPSYATMDASIGFAKDNWHFEIYGTNLTNSQASVFTSSAQYIKSEVVLRPLVVGFKIGASL